MTNKIKNIYFSGLLGLTALLSANTALAQTCVNAPDCAEIGFTKTTADCEGKTILKCPFDTNQVYCPGYEESTKTYSVGDTYYKDGVAAGVVAVVTDGGLHGIVVNGNSVAGTSTAEVKAACAAKSTAGLEWGIATCSNYNKVKKTINATVDEFFAEGGCLYSTSGCIFDSSISSRCKENGGFCQAAF